MKISAVLAFALILALSVAAQSRPNPEITMEQAKATALKKENGTIKSSELEKEHGRWIYSFDIAAADGIHEVNVDASTGKVIEDSKETAADEAKEATQDHKKEQKKSAPQQKPR